MARKSRTTDVKQEQAKEIKPLKTAIYARLSVENSGKSSEKDVISNQIEICKSYIADCPHLELVSIFIDNGKTGIVFDRPEFNKMMDAVKSGEIKCLVVRDLSRFGRDYIETGTYLERVFPQIGLRFISVKEQYDNFETTDKDTLMIPLQNMINSLYSKDISRKVSIALREQMASGKFKKRNIPYGYMWNEDKTKMIIDEVTAPYVKMIFQWKIEGVSVPKILSKLDEMNAPNTEKRKRETGVRNGDGDKCFGWYKSSVDGILTNSAYIGNTVLGKTESAIYKGINVHKVHDKNKLFIFENTHEPIISKEDFEKVEQIFSKNSIARKEKMALSEKQRAMFVDLFDCKIICADCGRRLYFHRKKIDKDKRGRWYAFYECSTPISKRYEKCTPHYIRQDFLHQKVLSAIQTQVKVALNYEKLIKKLKNSTGEKSIRDTQNAKIKSITLKLNAVLKKRERLYTDFADDLLDEEEYLYAKTSFDNECENLNHMLDIAVLSKTKFDEAMSSENQWITVMKSVSFAKDLNQMLVDETIEQIKIDDNKNVEIVMKYSDIYEDTLQSIKKIRRAM